MREVLKSGRTKYVERMIIEEEARMSEGVTSLRNKVAEASKTNL